MSLVKALKKANNIAYAEFRESDLDNSLTTIVLEPSSVSKRLCRNLKLALK